ncbi:ribosome maturation factor RimM [Candidatus Azobacteroides pseudotrichonymphae]|uniref:Ribosome maturation factor RimM n=1 Tax=Azobacteroides pseudotrichonymphae genomovar. CFP2 TaxID=511995 RepID=RIMM_AZOPC|nr:ribosome maturation factor RimM [Candidatus Azobacteroides pseudotrichonymphae]B6YRA4.1 RecName: Full=Ribosome maturation factor RimM [Candidatus Azobacteroides pseudotrichonymphae genomovar. CFP2]BAG83726.1 16S rRNA processing protein RimM [Candidatus Azobacteroides pseudotrichonymphae genomovar. CFP2]
MINFNELIKVGNFNKSHGIKGEISFVFTNNFFFKGKNSFLICEMEGIFIPFRVESYRSISNSTVLVKLKNINTIEQTKLLTYQEVFLPKKQSAENTKLNYFSWDHYIGFNIIDEKNREIGSITDIDKSTINTLFIVEKESKEILIPTANEMIVTIDEKRKIIYMKLPVGLL